METALLYIAGDNRSGSTLLDMMLAGHSNITSIGESHHIKAYALKDYKYYRPVSSSFSHELVCFCGEKIDQCPFWKKVESDMGIPMAGLELKPWFMQDQLKENYILYQLKRISYYLLNAFPSLYNYESIRNVYGGKEILNSYNHMYCVIGRIANTKYILDSSKSPHLMRLFASGLSIPMKVIFLLRDYRGVVSSKHKRGVDIVKAARQWKWTLIQMNQYKKYLSENNLMVVHYENLVNDTEKVMRSVVEFLDIDFEETLLRRNNIEIHHLGGSQSKRGGLSEKIILDDSYKKTIDDVQLKRIRKIVGKEAFRWGYDSSVEG